MTLLKENEAGIGNHAPTGVPLSERTDENPVQAEPLNHSPFIEVDNCSNRSQGESNVIYPSTGAMDPNVAVRMVDIRQPVNRDKQSIKKPDKNGRASLTACVRQANIKRAEMNKPPLKLPIKSITPLYQKHSELSDIRYHPAKRWEKRYEIDAQNADKVVQQLTMLDDPAIERAQRTVSHPRTKPEPRSAKEAKQYQQKLFSLIASELDTDQVSLEQAWEWVYQIVIASVTSLARSFYNEWWGPLILESIGDWANEIATGENQLLPFILGKKGDFNSLEKFKHLIQKHCSRRVRDYLDGLKRHEQSLDALASSTSLFADEASDRMLSLYTLAQIVAAVNQLTADQKAVIIPSIRAGRKLSNAEIAQETGLSENEVKSRLHRARERFKQLLKEQESAEAITEPITQEALTIRLGTPPTFQEVVLGILQKNRGKFVSLEDLRDQINSPVPDSVTQAIVYLRRWKGAKIKYVRNRGYCLEE